MESTSPEIKDNANESPQPEVLKARTDYSGATAAAAPPPTASTPQPDKKLGRRSYRPSHKATFIGLAAVAVILAVNGAILFVVLKKQAKNDTLLNKGQVTLSSGDLNKLGINRSAIGDSGIQLSVAPDAKFKGKVSVESDATISGQLVVNGKLTGTEANIAQLQAGNTSLTKLNVNEDTTLSNLTLRKDLVVTGTTRLQGPITLTQLLTVNNSVNVAGNLAVGGTLSVNTFSVHNLTFSGHIISSGSAPSVAGGSALGSNGTVSISGNDSAGAIGINIGVGASGGTLVSLAFRSNYTAIPRVVITPIGIGGSFYVFNLSVGGFSVGINSGLSPGGYRIDYIAIQ